jgi:hypothetical protein
MPLEAMRLRATNALEGLSTNKPVGILKVNTQALCDALLGVRDLLSVHGDSIVPSTAVLRLFAEQLPRLVASLETVSARSVVLLTHPGSDGG